MALLRRCDCCNDEVQTTRSFAVTVTDRMSMEVCETWDLCKQCKDDLVEDMTPIPSLA